MGFFLLVLGESNRFKLAQRWIRTRRWDYYWLVTYAWQEFIGFARLGLVSACCKFGVLDTLQNFHCWDYPIVAVVELPLVSVDHLTPKWSGPRSDDF